jgi:hypothetical protein
MGFGPIGCQVVRAAVPRAQSTPTGTNRSLPSNQSAVVSVDLPVGPLSPAERLNAVSHQFQAHLRHGEPGAAAFVLRAMNDLPPPAAPVRGARLPPPVVQPAGIDLSRHPR